jgi:hypothetical protein
MKNKIIDLFNASSPSLIIELKELFSEVFSLTEKEIIDIILQTNSLKGQGSKRLDLLSFVRSHEVDLPETFFEDLKSSGMAASMVGLKSSLKLENIHLLQNRMQTFIASFFREYEIPISVNMYVTPNQEAPCLATHSDYTDVFIFQLMGEKKWTFFRNEEGSFLSGDNEKASEKNEALKKSIKKEFITSTGDVFHIPALVYHEACSLEGPSVHVTVSLNRLRVEHMVQTIESAILEKMKVSKFKNLTNQEFESMFQEMMKFIGTKEMETIAKKKNEQLNFLSKVQIMSKGR